MHTKLIVLLATLIVGVFATTAIAQTHTTPVVPSNARAVHDTKVAILDRYIELLDTSRPARQELMPKGQADCVQLTDTLYRCAFFGKSPPFYTIFGRAKVRFYKYGTDVTLYGVKCYLDPSAGLDYCNR